MEFNFLDIFILPIIFLIGIVASIEDIRTGKIRNKWIIFGLVYGIIIYTMLFFWNELTLPISFVWERIFNLNPVAMINIKEGFLWKLGLNSSLSLLFGFLLWREGVVAAGDVKLYFVFFLNLKMIDAQYFFNHKREDRFLLRNRLCKQLACYRFFCYFFGLSIG